MCIDFIFILQYPEFTTQLPSIYFIVNVYFIFISINNLERFMAIDQELFAMKQIF